MLGRGRHRAQARKDVLKPRQGLDGEDVVDDGLALGLGLAAATSTTLKLRMPLRFSAGSVKGAAWQVGCGDVVEGSTWGSRSAAGPCAPGPRTPGARVQVRLGDKQMQGYPKMFSTWEPLVILHHSLPACSLALYFLKFSRLHLYSCQVLAEAGPNGMTLTELVRRIQRTGLRDLRTTKTPETSLACALGRDVLFVRVATSTWALTSVVNYHRKLAGKPPIEGGGRTRAERRAMKEAAEAAEAEAAEAEAAEGEGDQEMTEAGEGAEAKEEDGEGVKKEEGAEVKKEEGGEGAEAMEVDGVKKEPAEGVSEGLGYKKTVTRGAGGRGVKQQRMGSVRRMWVKGLRRDGVLRVWLLVGMRGCIGDGRP